MAITTNLQPKEIEYLKHLKSKWIQAEDSFKRLENARSQGLFWEQKNITQSKPIQDNKPKEQYQKRLFADEKQIVDYMTTKWYSPEDSRKTIENRRKDLLKDTKLDKVEAKTLIDFADAWLTTDKAVEWLNMLRDNKRKAEWEAMNPLEKVGKSYFDFVVRTLSGWVWEAWGIIDFATQWRSDLAKWWLEARDYGREAFKSKAWTLWEITWAWITDYALAWWAWRVIWWASKIPWLWKISKLSTWFNKLSTWKQMMLWWGWYSALATIWEKWEETTALDIGKATALWVVAWWVIGKWIKYWTAWYKWAKYWEWALSKADKLKWVKPWFVWAVKKSIWRDIKWVISAPWKIIDKWTEKIAWKILWSSSWKKELFKATSPSYQTLWKDKNIANIWKNIEKADETVLKYWYKPTNTETRATAFKGSMKKVWKQVEEARWQATTKVNASKFADTIDDEIARRIKSWEYLPVDDADTKVLKWLSDYYRKLWEVDVPTLWGMRSKINAETWWKMGNDYGDMYNSVMKKVWSEIRNTENSILWGIKWGKFKDLMLEYKALAETYPDILKANIKNMRAKGWSLEESLSRISWAGDILHWAGEVFTKWWKEWFWKIIGWVWKVALWKVYWKLKDVDFLIKEWYNKLWKSLSTKTIKNVNNINPNISSASKYSKKPTKTSWQKQVIKKTLGLPQKATTKPIITPQTKQAGQQITDKAIIQESKKWLEKIKFWTSKNIQELPKTSKAIKPPVKEAPKVVSTIVNKKTDIKKVIKESEILKEVKVRIKAKELEKTQRAIQERAIQRELPKNMTQFPDDLIKSFNKVKWNLNQSTKQGTLDKFSKIEELRKTNKNLDNLYNEIKDHIDKTNSDKLVQDIFEDLLDMKPSKAITPKVVSKAKVEAKAIEKNNLTQKDLNSIKEIQKKATYDYKEWVKKELLNKVKDNNDIDFTKKIVEFNWKKQEVIATINKKDYRWNTFDELYLVKESKEYAVYWKLNWKEWRVIGLSKTKDESIIDIFQNIKWYNDYFKKINVIKPNLDIKYNTDKWIIQVWNIDTNKAIPKPKAIDNKKGFISPKAIKESIIGKTKVDDLVSEAKKYKSADEFVKGLEERGEIQYHSTPNFNLEWINKHWLQIGKWQWVWHRVIDWIFLAKDKNLLKSNALNTKDKTLLKIFVDKNAKTKTFKTDMEYYGEFLFDDRYQAIDKTNNAWRIKVARKIMMDKWYDILEAPYWDWMETIILNTNVIKTESQLKEIYNKANTKAIPKAK